MEYFMRISEGANLSGLMAAVVNQAIWDLHYGGKRRADRGHVVSKERRDSALEFLSSPDLQLFTGFFGFEVTMKDILDNPHRIRRAFALKSKGLFEAEEKRAKVTEKSERLAQAKRVRYRADMYRKYQAKPRRSQEPENTLDGQGDV
jgi:hypothetical protein